MLENLPIYITAAFVTTTLASLLLFCWSVKNSQADNVRSKTNKILLSLVIWLIIQALLTFKNVYNTNTIAFPPKIAIFGVLPAIVTILILFLTKSGKQFIDHLPLQQLTWLHIVRIPVEIVLYCLFLNKAVPEIMTFAGRNFDILAGISAPFIAYFGFTKQKLSRRIILIWNFIALALLANIVITAVLSAPFFIQQFGFDQPNIAILYFPFSWLPTFIVPIVLFGHLVSIRQLLKSKKT